MNQRAMHRWGFIAILLVGTSAFAQSPPSGEADAAEPVTPCIPAGEIRPESAEAESGGTPPEPCTEADTADASGASEALEEDPYIEATADEVFEPGDEISEDYPVPLPADI